MLYVMLLVATACMPLGFAFGRSVGTRRRWSIAPMYRASR